LVCNLGSKHWHSRSVVPHCMIFGKSLGSDVFFIIQANGIGLVQRVKHGNSWFKWHLHRNPIQISRYLWRSSGWIRAKPEVQPSGSPSQASLWSPRHPHGIANSRNPIGKWLD
jgi:hypothetical protein